MGLWSKAERRWRAGPALANPRSLAIETTAHPSIVGATEYEAEAVVEDLNNVEALDRLASLIARRAQ